jgi:hypothetical protein
MGGGRRAQRWQRARALLLRCGPHRRLTPPPAALRLARRRCPLPAPASAACRPRWPS